MVAIESPVQPETKRELDGKLVLARQDAATLFLMGMPDMGVRLNFRLCQGHRGVVSGYGCFFYPCLSGQSVVKLQSPVIFSDSPKSRDIEKLFAI
jgi:hypothetical protein